ncbi:MAG: hypothetical protein EBZ91_09240 [Gammaproteobacteria bacterium]|nr:hypothetical protein [Gammaproteobacteria bacterium]
MGKFKSPRGTLGQGMTEYIIVVALIAVAAIGVYSAFGDVIRGQTSVAAAALSGQGATAGRTLVTEARTRATEQAKSKTLADYEK